MAVAVPKRAPSDSRSSFARRASGGRRRKKTLGSAVMTWKCFPMGRKLRNSRITTRWSQKLPWATASVGPGESPSQPACS